MAVHKNGTLFITLKQSAFSATAPFLDTLGLREKAYNCIGTFASMDGRTFCAYLLLPPLTEVKPLSPVLCVALSQISFSLKSGDREQSMRR